MLNFAGVDIHVLVSLYKIYVSVLDYASIVYCIFYILSYRKCAEKFYKTIIWASNISYARLIVCI